MKNSHVKLAGAGEAWNVLATRFYELRKAEGMVAPDLGIMGGELAIRGTLVPVYARAEMRRAGAAVEEIVAGYPSITTGQIAWAEIYAKAHPRRGRPVRRPWPNARLIRRSKQRLG